MKSRERYEFHEMLGSGNMGHVFRAFDRQERQDVAVKMLPEADPTAIGRLKEEFRALADVAHENLVTLLDLVVIDGTCWFTMELIQGVHFLEHVRGEAESKGANEARLRAAMSQLAEGIQALHKANKMHRDIKPSNVMVNHAGRVVLLDFGLVTEIAPASFRRKSDQIEGSIGYMAPEMTLSRQITEAADWYSFGVLLYEALTGRLPFEGTDDEVLAAKTTRDPAAPQLVEPSAPRDLSDLCVDLLCREPSGRPLASQILAALKGLPASRALESPWDEGIFVGRARELGELASAFEGVMSGKSVTVVVQGPSGIGKSALMRRFAEDLARTHKAVVLDGRCYEREWVPYKTLDSLADRLTEHLLGLPPDKAAELIPDDVRLLARVFPALRRLPAVAEADASSEGATLVDAQELRRRAFGALRALLGRLGRCSPLVMLIDDLQWGDADSVGPLVSLTSPPSPPPALLIVSCRDADAETSPPLKELLERWTSPMEGTDLRRLRLDPLAVEEARALASALLEQDTEMPQSVLDELAEAIALEAHGSPQFVQELALHARRRRKGGSEGAEDFAGAGSLGDAVLDRVYALRADERKLLEVVSVAGYPLREDVAALATGSAASVRPALASLQVLHLMLSRPSQPSTLLEPYHARIREAVVRNLSPEVRRRHHLDLAAALETMADADPQLLVEHAREAGDAERAGRFAAAAAERASKALAFHRAAGFYELALGSGVAGPARSHLLTSLAEALANAGRGKEAAQSFAEAAAELCRSGADPKDIQVTDRRRRAAEQYLRSGYIDEGISEIREVLAAVGARYPKSPAEALALLVIERARLGVWGARYRHRSRTPEPISDKVRVKLEAFRSAGLGLSMVDQVRAAYFQLLYERLAFDIGDRVHVARAVATRVAFLASEGGASLRRKSRKARKEAEQLANQVNDPYTQANFFFSSGMAAYFSGEWRSAVELCRRAQEIGRSSCTGVVWEMNSAQITELWALAYLGDLRELGRRLPELLKEARERDDVFAETSLRLGLPSMVWLAEGRVAEAKVQADHAMCAWPPTRFTSQHYFEVVARVQMDLYCGDGWAAWRRMKEAWPHLKGSLLLRLQHVRIELRHLLARATLAAAATVGGDWLAGAAAPDPGWSRKKLLRVVLREVREIDSEDAPWAAPLASLIRAGALAVTGETAAAVKELRSGAEGCARVELALHAASARLWLGALTAGPEGRVAEDQSLTQMKDCGVVEPWAMAAMLVPGFSRRGGAGVRRGPDLK